MFDLCQPQFCTVMRKLESPARGLTAGQEVGAFSIAIEFAVEKLRMMSERRPIAMQIIAVQVSHTGDRFGKEEALLEDAGVAALPGSPLPSDP